MTTWVLLRGLAREARHWGAFPELLRSSLPPGDAVLALDLPGNGALWLERSSTSVADMVIAARNELALARCRPPFVLVAVSLGGMVALQWAAGSREVVGCVLINSSIGRLSRFWQRLRPRAYPALLSLLLPAQGALRRERRVLRLTSNLPADLQHVQRWARYAESRPVARSNVLRQLVAAARFRWTGAPPPVPMLLLASKGDKLVSRECSSALAAHWRLPLREHPWAGHDLPLDDPEWVADAIVQWHRESIQ